MNNIKQNIGGIMSKAKTAVSNISKNKKLLTVAIAVFGILMVSGIVWQYAVPKNNSQGNNGDSQQNQPENKLSPLNCQYIVEGQVATLKDGKEETVSPYNNQKVTTKIVGTPQTGDLNTDGEKDYAVIITQKTDGDLGIYYYAAVALANEKAGVIAGTVAVPLGDRIVIESTAIVNDAFRINYLDWRTTGDTVESSPTLPVTKTFILDGIMLKEITDKRANAQAEAACTDNGGTWTKETNECKGLSPEWCQQNAGKPENGTCKF